jgi:uroporphyrinogen decarboxylase
MNRRERVLAAINRQPVDRVATDIWTTAEVWQKLRDHFGEGADIMSELHIDGMNYVRPSYNGPALSRGPNGEFVDYWGMRRIMVPHEGGAYAEVVYNPLAEAKTIDDLNNYEWPEADWFDYSNVRERAAAARNGSSIAAI